MLDAIPRHGFAIVAILGPPVIVLGTIGFEQQGKDLLESIYRAFALLTFEVPFSPEPVPWELQIARFAAPLLTALGLAATVMTVLRDRTDKFRARLTSGHVVICGLGDRGVALLDSFLYSGEEVVVIEVEETSPTVNAARARAVPTLIGDARDPKLLEAAGVRRARRVVAVCSGDNVNAAIVAAVRELAPVGEKNPVHVNAHLSDASLCDDLTAHSMEVKDGVLVEWFNIERIAAKALLSDYFGDGPHSQKPREPESIRGIGVVGTGAMAASLVAETARHWGPLVRKGMARPLPVTIVGEGADRLHTSIDREIRGIDAAIALSSIERVTGDPTELSHLQVLFVCIDDPLAGVREALGIREILASPGARRAKVVVRVFVDAAGLAQVLQQERHQIEVVNVIETSCSAALVEHELIEELARENHRVYVEGVEGEPASRPWAEVSEEDRESNRNAATDHLREKLPAVGYRFVPILGLDAELVEFSETQIEELSKMEHQRWMQEKIDLGWERSRDPSAPQDRDRKIHADLVPWEELGEIAREKDRMFVRALPQMLLRCGYVLTAADAVEVAA